MTELEARDARLRNRVTQRDWVVPVKNVDDARIAYQTAISLWVYEGNLIWSKFNAMLVANSIVLAVVGFAQSSTVLSHAVKTALPVVGTLLCLFWLHLTKRGFDYCVYWIVSARELEEKYFSAEVRTVSRGGRFANGSRVVLDIDGTATGFQMSRVSRSMTTEWSAYLVIASFVALYLLQLFG